MIRRAALLIALTAWPVVAQAGFREVVTSVEAATGSRQIYIPFMSMARTFFRVVEPKGVSDFRVAVLQSRGNRRLQGDLDQAVILKAAGPGWQTIVQTERRSSGERALIYARPAPRQRMRMIVVAHERDEAAVIELELDMKEFSEFIAKAQRSNSKVSFSW